MRDVSGERDIRGGNRHRDRVRFLVSEGRLSEYQGPRRRARVPERVRPQGAFGLFLLFSFVFYLYKLQRV